MAGHSRQKMRSDRVAVAAHRPTSVDGRNHVQPGKAGTLGAQWSVMAARIDLSGIPAAVEHGVSEALREAEPGSVRGAPAHVVGMRLAQLGRGGEPLAPEIESRMEQHLGQTVGGVRVHTGAEADFLAKTLRAQAFTRGTDIVFANGRYRPDTAAGAELLAHELAHVVQQRRRSSGHAGVQCRIHPEDVSKEMVGQKFSLTKASGTLAAGTEVVIVAWDNDEPTVTVRLVSTKDKPKSKDKPKTFDVVKLALKPVRPSAEGVVPYRVGMSSEIAAVEKSEAGLTAFNATEAEYDTPAKYKKFAAEQKRRMDQLQGRRKELNSMLIRETMFNRFDATIKKEVDAANKGHGYTGKDALDPNLFKALLYQESRLGTSGLNLFMSGESVRTNYNIGQVIVSSGLALLTLFEKEQPPLMTAFKLGGLRADLEAAMLERNALNKKKAKAKKKELGESDAARLERLDALSFQNWEQFIWSYKAAGSKVGFADAVNAFFEAVTPHRNVDYDFWIHLSLTWLFEKHKPGMSWPQTIAAYNGSPADAENYKTAVTNRAANATAKSKAKKDFIPDP